MKTTTPIMIPTRAPVEICEVVGQLELYQYQFAFEHPAGAIEEIPDMQVPVEAHHPIYLIRVFLLVSNWDFFDFFFQTTSQRNARNTTGVDRTRVIATKGR